MSFYFFTNTDHCRLLLFTEITKFMLAVTQAAMVHSFAIFSLQLGEKNECQLQVRFAFGL